MKLKQLLKNSYEELRQASVDNPELDARILLQYILGEGMEIIYLSPDLELNEELCGNYMQLIARRATLEPVAKIIGRKDFWQSSFMVNNHTLDPRPDSEVIIEASLKLFPQKQENYRFLDLGTGSGCLILSLLQEFPQATAVAIDISMEALKISKQNTENLKLQDRIDLIQGHWADGIDEKFDLIVSNPPYIPSADIETLANDVKFYDPMLALDGGKDGLDPYRYLAKQILPLLKASGYAILEFGYGQSESVTQIFSQQSYSIEGILTDLGGIKRAIIVKA